MIAAETAKNKNYINTKNEENNRRWNSLVRLYSVNDVQK